MKMEGLLRTVILLHQELNENCHNMLISLEIFVLLRLNVCGHLPTHPYVALLETVKVGNMKLCRMSLYVVAIQYPFFETKRLSPNMFQHDSAPFTKSRSIKAGVCKVEWKTLRGLHRSLILNPSEG